MIDHVKCITWPGYAAFFTGNLHFAYVEASDATSLGAKYGCYLKNSVLDVKYPASYTRLFVSRGLLHVK